MNSIGDTFVFTSFGESHSAAIGGVMDPTKNKEVCAIVKLKHKTDVHRANLTDDFQAAKSMLIQKQSAEFIHNWIIKKQKETYVQIDPRWAGCDFQFPNWVH